ncbi:MAG: hypothetical protein LBN93_10800 [Candidatus Symbiothrix sp.]|nr:hypothetical protein [Candidatus Symbiothrix sp.]
MRSPIIVNDRIWGDRIWDDRILGNRILGDRIWGDRKGRPYSALMNDAGYKFKRYEDSSLAYIWCE